MSIYKLFGAGSGGTENSLASLDIQNEGVIVGIWGSLLGDLDADTETLSVEASFLSTNTIASNDARGSLFLLSAQTAGAANFLSQNAGISGLAIPVAAGERVHLHVVASAGVTCSAHIYLHVNDGASAELRRRR